MALLKRLVDKVILEGEKMNKEAKTLMGSTFLGFSIVMIIYIVYKLVT